MLKMTDYAFYEPVVEFGRKFQDWERIDQNIKRLEKKVKDLRQKIKIQKKT
jgi:hypothetical protein